MCNLLELPLLCVLELHSSRASSFERNPEYQRALMMTEQNLGKEISVIGSSWYLITRFLYETKRSLSLSYGAIHKLVKREYLQLSLCLPPLHRCPSSLTYTIGGPLPLRANVHCVISQKEHLKLSQKVQLLNEFYDDYSRQID